MILLEVYTFLDPVQSRSTEIVLTEVEHVNKKWVLGSTFFVRNAFEDYNPSLLAFHNLCYTIEIVILV